jgi:hypothetical protein
MIELNLNVSQMIGQVAFRFAAGSLRSFLALGFLF